MPETNEEFDKTILANYLLYKLLEEYYEFSFKTRLLKIHYTDSTGTISKFTQYAFFLEPVRSFKKRLNLSYIELSELSTLNESIQVDMNKEYLSKVNAFEFFIATISSVSVYKI